MKKMGKNDFDMEFNFDEEFDFDPNAFLGTDDFDKDIDLSEFTDEELGLAPAPAEEEPAEADLDVDLGDDLDFASDLDLKDLMDLGDDEDLTADFDFEKEFSAEPEEADEPEEEEEEEDPFAFATEDDDLDLDDLDLGEEEDSFEDEDLSDEPDFPAVSEFSEDEEETETAMDETMIFPPRREQREEAYQQPQEEEPSDFQEEAVEEEASEEENVPAKNPRRRQAPKEKKEFKMPQFTTPSFLTKFYELYFAPLTNKSLLEEPVDPNKPRRRRKKSKVQIFKEVYLPPILVCLTAVMVLVFVVGSISNIIDTRQQQKETERLQAQAESNEAARIESEYETLMREAEELAASYDYKGAIEKLNSFTGVQSDYPDLVSKLSEYTQIQATMVEYRDPSLIPNLSFHVLIADPTRAFADPELGGNYNKNFVTIDEFSKILDQLYANGYILVDFDSFTELRTNVDGSQQFIAESLYLPEDRKPVMITETMVNYFEYMIDSNDDGTADAGGAGFASKLVVDENGDIKAEYVDINSQTHVGNYDLVPILEDFIKEHPDFVYQGARATLAVTGSEGIFGYRCTTAYNQSRGTQYYDEQVAGAKKIVEALRNKGYTLACFTYGNSDYSQYTANQIQQDLADWTQQIKPIIGDVNILVYARTADINDYSGTKFNVMSTSGFRYFVSNAKEPWAEINTNYVRQKRLMVTGENMAWYSSMFTDRGLFDPNMVLDATNRGNVPKS